MQTVSDVLGALPPILVYVVVAALVAAESAVVAGLVLPSATALIALGLAANAGTVNVVPAVLIAVAAACLGGTVAYFSGRRSGRRISSTRLGRRVGAHRWDRAERLFTRHGGRAIFLGQWVVGARTLVPRLAGMNGVPYRRFAAWHMPAATLWAGWMVGASYLAGASYDLVAARAGHAGGALAALAALIVGLVVAGRWFGRRPGTVRAWAKALYRLTPVHAVACRIAASRSHAGRPAIAGAEPATAGLTATATAQPATAGAQPTTTGAQPTTTGTRPATAGTQPTTAGTQPTTAGAPSTTAGAPSTTAGAPPATTGALPTTAGTRPTTAGRSIAGRAARLWRRRRHPLAGPAIDVALSVGLFFGLAVLLILVIPVVVRFSGLSAADTAVTAWARSEWTSDGYLFALDAATSVKPENLIALAAAVSLARWWWMWRRGTRSLRRDGATGLLEAIGPVLPMAILAVVLAGILPPVWPAQAVTAGGRYAVDSVVFPSVAEFGGNLPVGDAAPALAAMAAGSTTQLASAVGLLAWLLSRRLPWSWRATVWTVAACYVTVCAGSWVYLGWSRISETVAALAVGVAWTALNAAIWSTHDEPVRITQVPAPPDPIEPPVPADAARR
jgi:membrane protein DedA with SNARE-associated domain